MKPEENKTTGEDQAGPTKTVELINFEAQAEEAAMIANLPSLSGAKVEVAAVDLMEGYWTPAAPGESKRLYFVQVRDRQTLDQNTGEVVTLPAVYFLEESEDGEWKSICNQSSHLVSRFEKGDIPKHTPVLITYTGKEKNATNANMSDRWRVNPLIINV